MSGLFSLLLASERAEVPFFTLTALTAGSTVSFNTVGTLSASPALQYRKERKNSGWYDYSFGTVIHLPNIGDSVQFRNLNSNFSTNMSNYIHADCTGELSASGDIQSLANWSSNAVVCPYLFLNAKSLTDAESLVLSAKYGTAQAVYLGTFRNSGLTGAAPVIKLQSAGQSAMHTMFWGTSIQSAELEFTEVPNVLYFCYGMFQVCKSLTSLRVHFTSWTPSDNPTDRHQFDEWFIAGSTSGTFYKPAALPEEYAQNRIPTGWTVVNI